MMNFDPSQLMQQRMQQMIQQRYGSPENMLNDMKRFAKSKNIGVLDNAMNLFEKGDINGLSRIGQNVCNENKQNPMSMIQNLLGMKQPPQN